MKFLISSYLFAMKILQADNNVDTKLPLFGRGSGLSESDCQRFIRKLVIEGFLSEQIFVNQHQGLVGYVSLSQKGQKFLDEHKKVDGKKEKVRPLRVLSKC